MSSSTLTNTDADLRGNGHALCKSAQEPMRVDFVLTQRFDWHGRGAFPASAGDHALGAERHAVPFSQSRFVRELLASSDTNAGCPTYDRPATAHCDAA